MEDKVVVILKRAKNDPGIDVEIPTNISANELIYGLNQGFSLGINMDNPRECFLRAENPIALLRGEKSVKEFGIRNGSTIHVER